MTAMVAAADCLVSLHRGEGLGLHLADAMWLQTAVLASRYSGNLDFMDDRIRSTDRRGDDRCRKR